MFDIEQLSRLRDEPPILRSYDFDGVVSIGVLPGKHSMVVTGRTIKEASHVYKVMSDVGVKLGTPCHFNPTPLDVRERWHSGIHKALVLLWHPRIDLDCFDHIHFDDDPLQINVMKDVFSLFRGNYSDSNLTAQSKIWGMLLKDDLVDEGLRPRDIFIPERADILHRHLKFVHVNCPWVEK